MGTAWKVSKCGVFSGPYFPKFGLTTETYRVSLCIHFQFGKIRTRKNSVFGHFSCSGGLQYLYEGWENLVFDQSVDLILSLLTLKLNITNII